jgi:hypothetical protein
VEVLIEFPHLRDGVEFLGILVPTFNQKLELAHHLREFGTVRQRVAAERS